MKGESLSVFADGGARGNPGPAAIGFVIKDSKGKVLVEQGKFIGKATNNMAEYQAVIEALKWIIAKRRSSVSAVQFFLDSQLVVNQLSGIFKIKNFKLRNLIVEVRQLERDLGGNVSYHFIPRGKNKKADSLVNQSLDRQTI